MKRGILPNFYVPGPFAFIISSSLQTYAVARVPDRELDFHLWVDELCFKLVG